MAKAHRGESDKSDAETPDTPDEVFDEHDVDDTPADDAPADGKTAGAKETSQAEAGDAAPVKRPAKKRSAKPVSTPASSPSGPEKASGKDASGKKKFVPTATAGSGGKSRRQRMADLAEQQRRADRRRRLGLIALCVVLALGVLAWPAYEFIRKSIIESTPRAELGVAAADAGCLPEESNPATGNQEHVPDGTTVPYPRLPPDSGPHYNEWTDFAEKFYTPQDRPEVERLVHNLEHGYVVLWYSTEMSEDERDVLKALVNTYSENNPSAKVKAAPWSPTNDGGAFPEGTNLMLTRWVADPAEPTNVAKQKAVRMACNRVSGEVLEQFKEKYPATAAPEPNGG